MQDVRYFNVSFEEHNKRIEERTAVIAEQAAKWRNIISSRFCIFRE